MKVEVIDLRTKKPKIMEKHFADILVKLKRVEYSTRDLSAEGVASPTGRQKRQYRRRDMQAE